MIREEVVKVGMADLRTIRGSGILRTTGLGSCVGLSLYDPVSKVAGMAHIMLPSSELAWTPSVSPAKYADTAIPELIRQMTELGALTGRLEAKLAGGAQMFASVSGGDSLRIGPRNTETCRRLLQERHIPISGEDTGGHYGRTIEFHCGTGVLYVRSVQRGVREL
jgi:chemotaxis protein CheD